MWNDCCIRTILISIFVTVTSQQMQKNKIAQTVISALNHSNYDLSTDISSGNTNWLHQLNSRLYSIPFMSCDNDDNCTSTYGKCKHGNCNCKLPFPILHLQSQRCLSATYAEGGYCEYTIQCYQIEMKCINYICTKNHSFETSLTDRQEFKVVCVVAVMAGVVIFGLFVRDRLKDRYRNQEQRRQAQIYEDQLFLMKPEFQLCHLPTYEEATQQGRTSQVERSPNSPVLDI